MTSRTKTILVVDDEPDILSLVTFCLTRESFGVRAALDGITALEAASHEVPDLVVLDLMLPGMTGWDILRELRRRPATSGTPVVLLSARTEQEDRSMAEHFGAADYITKPFSPGDLVRRIEAVLARVSAPPHPAPPLAATAEFAAADPVVLAHAAGAVEPLPILAPLPPPA